MTLVRRPAQRAVQGLTFAALCLLSGMSIGPVQKIALEGTTWRVSTLNGRSLRETSAPPLLALDSKAGRASGFTGCNDFSARYRRAGSRLTFQRVAYTRKGCLDPPLAKTEATFLEALIRVRSWRIQGSTLMLRNSSGRSVMTLESGREADSRDRP